jgi:hypothetical protein
VVAAVTDTFNYNETYTPNIHQLLDGRLAANNIVL